MIAVGDLAPDFRLRDQHGTEVQLSELRGRPVVLYFFPKANTPGCTRETIDFARSLPQLEGRGTHVLGISVDSVATQEKFAARCAASFPLLSDSDREVARRYGVLGLFHMAKRVTFILDGNGRVVQVVEGMRPGPHVAAALARFGPAP